MHLEQNESTTGHDAPRGRYVRGRNDTALVEGMDRAIARPRTRAGGMQATSAHNLLTLKPNEEVLLPRSEGEFEELLKQQATLAQKKVVQGLTDSESRELKMIRWVIDRVENERIGNDIKSLEKLVTLHERLATEVSRLIESIKTD